MRGNAMKSLVLVLAGTLCADTLAFSFGGHDRLARSKFGSSSAVRRSASAMEGVDFVDASDSTQLEETLFPGKVTSSLITNSLVLGGLLTTAGYGVLHNDLEKLSALAPQADHYKAAVAMLRHLPTEWLAWYDDEALEFPLMTKASTSGVCYFLGDLCAQALSGKSLGEVRLGRAARSGAAGFIGHGPIAHYWLNFLDQYLSFDGEWWAVIPKIAIDQGPMSIVYNTIYSLLLGAFAFRDPRAVLRDVRAAFLPGFEASIRFWPLVHLVTFSVVPVELQVLWVDAAEIVWVCILSGVNNDGTIHDTDETLEEKILLADSDNY